MIFCALPILLAVTYYTFLLFSIIKLRFTTPSLGSVDCWVLPRVFYWLQIGDACEFFLYHIVQKRLRSFAAFPLRFLAIAYAAVWAASKISAWLSTFFPSYSFFLERLVK